MEAKPFKGRCACRLRHTEFDLVQRLLVNSQLFLLDNAIFFLFVIFVTRAVIGRSVCFLNHHLFIGEKVSKLGELRGSTRVALTNASTQLASADS